jgi:hypothetical protein
MIGCAPEQCTDQSAEQKKLHEVPETSQQPESTTKQVPV